MTSPERLAPGVVCGALLAATASAQDMQDHTTDGLARRLEMPAHRALMAVRGDARTPLAPFRTDGCSGGLSDAWHLVADRLPALTAPGQETPLWEDCCVIHDRAYHAAGGTTEAGASFEARLDADRALRACVAETGQQHTERLAATQGMRPDEIRQSFGIIAGAMYLAVRFGGGPCSGLPWRWGFGFPDCSVLGGTTVGRGPGEKGD